MKMIYPIKPGYRYPFGIKIDDGGVNFSVFSRHASSIELLLFERAEDTEPFQVIPLPPDPHCTFFAWHVYVEGLPHGVYYNWRASGPAGNGDNGFRFDAQKALIDPWARAVYDGHWQRQAACDPGANHQATIRAIVPDLSYDWQEDQPLHNPTEHSIIYELHVGGFTRHPSSGVAHPGLFAGLREKIPYLKELGVTHVELMPVMAFDRQDVPPGVAARGLGNYWGYSTHSFYAPHPGYCACPDSSGQIREFRDLVRAFHQAGLGVIMDVVYNHTSEGGADGPTMNFKGIGNEMFYHLAAANRAQYRDYTGCGNSINANHPLVARFIRGSLEYWTRDMRVDGFRFDLASALARGEDGNPLYNAPVLWDIEFSNTLAHTSLIAEAWDALGLYQVGGFPGFRWQEWNGQYRDAMRRFVRGDAGMIKELATRLSGSSDLYQAAGRLPINSINFITSHDGFTLYDLVSYNSKHNEANGEDNRDGNNDNLSWNCGVEGDSDDPAILALRRRQARNFMAILLLSHGVPMLLSGDEVLRSQQGNNNAYCQDNELSWLDWNLMEKNRDMLRFTREMIALRKRHPSLMRRRFLSGKAAPGSALPDVAWHGYQLGKPLWDDPRAQVLAYTLAATNPDEAHLHIILNMSEQSHEFPLPEVAGHAWQVAVDTGAEPPADIIPRAQQQPVVGLRCPVARRSVVVLEAAKGIRI
jgi:glycogen operon protein